MRRCWNCGQPAENESYGVCGETECLKTAIKSRMTAAQKIAAKRPLHRRRRKTSIHNPACRQCSIFLIDENWWPSYKKHNNRVCKTCAREYAVEYLEKKKKKKERRAKKAKPPTEIKDEWRSLPLDEFTEKVSNAQRKRRGKRKLTKKQEEERRAKEQIRRWCRNKYGKDWWTDHEIRAQRKQEAKEALGLTDYSWL